MKTNSILEIKGLPASVQTEGLVLGAAFLDASWCDQLVVSLRAEDFFLDGHKRIFRAIQELREMDAPVDRITVCNRLQQTGDLEAVGGLTYLVDLDRDLPQVSNPEHYAKIVRDKSKLRRIIFACNHTMNRCAEDADTPEDVIDGHQRSLGDLDFEEHGDWLTPGEIMDRYPGGRLGFLQRQHNGNNGIATPWPCITDDLCGGLHRGELVIVAGRPSMGKSVVGLQIAHTAAKAGHGTAFISLEMSKESLIDRLIACVGRVDHQRFKLGYLEADERARAMAASNQIADIPLSIDDTRARTIRAQKAAVLRLSKKGPVDLLVVDHLQLMKGDRAESRTLELGEILHCLKIMSVDLKICVVLLMQLSRQCEIECRLPQLSDLAETGTSEQDADVVMFVHRAERYAKNRDRPELRGAADFIIGKQRNGPAGKRSMIFNAYQQRFDVCVGNIRQEQEYGSSDD